MCLKCGVAKKSGKRSCCVRGGAWFKYCGEAGDGQFAHTWAEGIQACKDFATSLPVKSPLQVMFRDVAVTVYTVDTAQPQNTTQHRMKNIYRRPGSMPSAGTTNFEGCVGLAKVFVCIPVSFVVLFL